jgi:hypothetical protein
MAAKYNKQDVQFDTVGAEHIIRDLSQKVSSTKKAFDAINETVQQIVDIATKHDIDVACVVVAPDGDTKHKDDETVKRLGVLLSSQHPETILDAIEALARVLYTMAEDDTKIIEAMERYVKMLVSYQGDESKQMSVLKAGQISSNE